MRTDSPAALGWPASRLGWIRPRSGLARPDLAFLSFSPVFYLFAKLSAGIKISLKMFYASEKCDSNFAVFSTILSITWYCMCDF
jgi:hypothetical protein